MKKFFYICGLITKIMAHYLDPKNDLTFKRVFGELWLRFLTEIDEQTKEIPSELLTNEHLSEAIGYMERGAYTKEQLITYDKFRDAVMTELSVIDDAMVKGEAIGMKKGRAEGKADERKIIAKNLIATGMPLDQIALVTNIDIEELKSL